MVTNNKILTVSYGTFSCTLEGFDESFDTMKAIAEYFRDLAADDRYFGAEPPVPDAEMLARIAEREIERRVEASLEKGAIILRAGSQAAAVQTTSVQTATKTNVQVDTPADIPADIPTKAASTAVVAAPVVDTSHSAPIEEDMPANEADVEKDLPTQTAELPVASTDILPDAHPETQPDIQPDTQKAPIEEAAVDDAIAPAAFVEDPRKDDALIAAVQTAQDNETKTGTPIVDDLNDADTPVRARPRPSSASLMPQDDDSIAAKLQRIRAVVSKVEALPEDEDFSEDEHAESLLTPTRQELEAALTMDDEMAASLAQSAANADAADIEEAVLTDIADADPEKESLAKRAQIVRMKRADFDAAVASGLLEAEEDEEEGGDTNDEYDHTAIDAELAAMQDASSLTAEDEADLLAELAEVEAELSKPHTDPNETAISNGETDGETDGEAGEELDGTADGDDGVHDPYQPRLATEARGQHLSDGDADADVDMSRILAETNTQLEEPESSRRRRAIAHLRAAVAATKAEQKAGVITEPEDEAEVYREDLASVVRPLAAVETSPEDNHRPAKNKKRASKSAPAPLKLVAEQRIDTDVPKERGPVRPRRVSSADRTDSPQAAPVGAPTIGADSFVEYAESVGATKLPEILEAAAAYLTFVEGQQQFSRPTLIRMARKIDEDTYNREDGLRGFGQLLRQNKIEKVANGRFTASERINFKPEDRAAS